MCFLFRDIFQTPKKNINISKEINAKNQQQQELVLSLLSRTFSSTSSHPILKCKNLNIS